MSLLFHMLSRMPFAGVVYSSCRQTLLGFTAMGPVPRYYSLRPSFPRTRYCSTIPPAVVVFATESVIQCFHHDHSKVNSRDTETDKN